MVRLTDYKVFMKYSMNYKVNNLKELTQYNYYYFSIVINKYRK